MQRILSYMRRAVTDYEMIKPGDKIAVGVSGGKDSLCLLEALSRYQKFSPVPFSIEAITIDMGLEGMDFEPVKEFCQKLGVNYTIRKTEIAQVVFEYRKEKNPCSLCAKMRRGALNNAAKELLCNKVALGHHSDDVVETFFLCLLYEGRVYCFSPVTYLDKTDLYLIRPFLYLPEREIKRYVYNNDVPVVESKCPADKHTSRQVVKDMLSDMYKKDHCLKQKLFTAIQNSGIEGFAVDNIKPLPPL